MKGRVIVILFLLTVLSFKAQYSSSAYNSEAFEVFQSSKNLSVVLTGDEAVDNQLREAVTKNWTLTPAVFITNEEFKTSISEKSTCFLVYLQIKQNDAVYDFYSIIPGGHKNLSKYGIGELLAYCPLDVAMTEAKFSSVAFRFPLIVTSLQNSINTVKKLKMTGMPFAISLDFNEINCKKLSKIRTKTLLISDELQLKAEDIAKVYKYKFEICSKAKIAEAIQKKDPNFLVFHSARTANKYTFIFECETYNCIYSDVNIMSLPTRAKDFSEIIKTLSK